MVETALLAVTRSTASELLSVDHWEILFYTLYAHAHTHTHTLLVNRGALSVCKQTMNFQIHTDYIIWE